MCHPKPVLISIPYYLTIDPPTEGTVGIDFENGDRFLEFLLSRGGTEDAMFQFHEISSDGSRIIPPLKR